MFSTKIKIAGLMIFLLTGLTFGGSLTGALTDMETGEPVPGAIVKLMGYDIAVVSGSDGMFTLEGLPLGEGRLVISHVGYNIAKKSVNISLQSVVNIELEPKILKGQDIIVTATRAKRGQTPAAFSNMTNKDIEQNYWAQETPILLSSMPNIFAYSDAGNGVGYSYLKIRGFDQKRVSVMINGIPLNDAKSHDVYWTNQPNFVSNVQDIQVQRGVGSSLYGQSALGGSINLITSDFSAVPRLNVETGYGSYNTKKFSIAGNSGLINDSYVFYGRYSRIESDGYRDNSWSKLHSFFFGLARYDENMTWKFNSYSAPVEDHLAYKGIEEDLLNTNRKYNELEFRDEIEQFNQPHYEFFHDWQVSDNLELSNTIYYFHGDGFWNQKRNRKRVDEYFTDFSSILVGDSALAPADYYDIDIDDLTYDTTFIKSDDSLYVLERVDVVRYLFVDENDLGWIPRVTYKHLKGVFTLGGEMRIHSGHHYGEVRWASVYPQGLEPDARYYDYREKSNTFTVYAHESYNILNRLTLVANIQYQRHKYELYEDKRFNANFNRDYDFISPRTGLNYQINGNLNLFSSIATASRQPAFNDIYDPTDYWEFPTIRPHNFSSSMEYIGPELKPEKLLDLELGMDLHKRTRQLVIKGTVNLYYMQVTDELIPYLGQYDDDGYPVSGNAEKTLHQGIELSLDTKFRNELFVTGNVSINNDRFVDYKEYGWGGIVDRSNKKIGGFPSMLVNYRLGYVIEDLEMGVNGRYVGKQYIDNGEQFKLDPYHILNADISYNFGKLVGVNSLKAVLRVNNLSDLEYEQAAYIEEDDGLPRYMVGADRNLYFSISAMF